MLIVKLLIVAVLIWLGAVNRYVLIPGLAPRAQREAGAPMFRLSRLARFGPRRGVSSDGVFAAGRVSPREGDDRVAVFACTAVLGEITPGRHVRSSARGRATWPPSSGARPASPPGSERVTPPPGDAGRGRAVFVKLKCAACHTVQGERFSRPDRPGPDLTDVGAATRAVFARVDHEPERENRRRARLHRRSGLVDHAGQSGQI